MSLFDLSHFQQARISAINKSFKNDKVVMDKKELVVEHKKLTKVLDSPSHEDDKEEAKKQKKELDGLLEKGRKSQPIGTIKEFGGRNYIKAADGTWKFHGKGTGAKAQEHVKGSLQHHINTASQKHTLYEVHFDNNKNNIERISASNPEEVKKKLEKRYPGQKVTHIASADSEASLKVNLLKPEMKSKDQILSSYRSELKEALKKDKGDEEGKNVTVVLDKYMNMPGEHDSDHLNEILDEEISRYDQSVSHQSALTKLKDQLKGIDPKSEEAQNIIEGFASKYQGDPDDINAVLTNLSVTSPPKKGTIIGKTRSGKDIVEGQDPSRGDKFPGWTSNDHVDAIEAHEKVAGAAKNLGNIYYKQNEKERAVKHYATHDSHMKSVKGHKLAIKNWKFND